MKIITGAVMLISFLGLSLLMGDSVHEADRAHTTDVGTFQLADRAHT